MRYQIDHRRIVDVDNYKQVLRIRLTVVTVVFVIVVAFVTILSIIANC